jgi:hypothetical protein
MDGLTNAERFLLQAFGATRSAFRFEGAELGATQKSPRMETFEMGYSIAYSPASCCCSLLKMLKMIFLRLEFLIV